MQGEPVVVGGLAATPRRRRGFPRGRARPSTRGGPRSPQAPARAHASRGRALDLQRAPHDDTALVGVLGTNCVGYLVEAIFSHRARASRRPHVA